ncbi:MAG TPA: tyrosine-type recombinase/integrase [Pirellulales bacterium]|jgi:integrase
MTQHTTKPVSGKPTKPYPEFPLFAHASGRWCKKIRGKHCYFGPIDNWQAALAKYQDQIDDLRAGRTPRVNAGELTIRDLANRFMTSKSMLRDTGELTHRTWADYHASCARLCAFFGKTRHVADLISGDFELLRTDIAKTRALVSLGNEVQRIRSIFKYAFDEGLIQQPIRYGQAFKRPTKRTLTIARNARGPRMFEAVEIQSIIAKAGAHLKAMALLGINAGLGNADVARLEFRHIDLSSGWLNYPRVKTGADRRCPLWKETIVAIHAAVALRPEPKNLADSQIVFITKYGGRWENGKPGNALAQEMAKLLKELGIHRPGLNFYALRHTTETIGGDALDQVALNHIMGHSPPSTDMSSVYRERINDDRLRAVSDHVRAWLFPPQKRITRKAK